MPEDAALLGQDFARLRETLGRCFALSGDWRLFRAIRALRLLEASIRRPLRVAVLGEENAGKSSLINVLMRDDVVPAGALAGIRAHLLLRHGAEPALHAVSTDGSRARLTSRALARMSGPEMRSAPRSTIIYDAAAPVQPARRETGLVAGAGAASADTTPRLIEIIRPNALLRRAELVESRGCPEAAGKSVLRHAFPVDLAVWCTLGTQAWKESERLSWARLPAKLRKGAILVITYKDAIGTARDEAKLLVRAERDAGRLFGDIVLVSLRQAAEALGPGGTIAEEARWQRSGAAAFEAVLQGRLATLEAQRWTRALRLLRKLTAATRQNEVSAAAAPPLPAEMHKAFQALLRRIEARPAPGRDDPAGEAGAPGGEGDAPAVFGRETC